MYGILAGIDGDNHKKLNCCKPDTLRHYSTSLCPLDHALLLATRGGGITFRKLLMMPKMAKDKLLMTCLMSMFALLVLAIEAKQNKSASQEQIGIFISSPNIPTMSATMVNKSPAGSPDGLTGRTYGLISAGLLGSPPTFIATGILNLVPSLE